MTYERQRLGKAGEDLAVSELERRGYAIVARRYRTRHGEIDIVAKDGEIIAFVEVKARTSAEFGSAAEALAMWKKRRLTAMAEDYLARHCITDCPCRFDVVAIDACDSDPVVTVYTNAFDAV